MVSTILIAAIAALHIYIAVLEMAMWEGPAARRAFRLTPELARDTKNMAANQGLYNLFLVAALVIGLVQGGGGFEFKLFGLGCVAVAGIFGALTVSRRIFFVQTVPAALAMAALFAGI